MIFATRRLRVLCSHFQVDHQQAASTLKSALVSAKEASQSKPKGPQTRRYGGALVAQTLREAGISHVFTLTGGVSFKFSLKNCTHLSITHLSQLLPCS